MRHVSAHHDRKSPTLGGDLLFRFRVWGSGTVRDEAWVIDKIRLTLVSNTKGRTMKPWGSRGDGSGEKVSRNELTKFI